MKQTITIVRGLPGSGKTTLASEMMNNYFIHPIGPKWIHIEADMYHLDIKGEYKWKPELVRESHAWCYSTARIYLAQGYSIIVSNTFTQHWEYEKYIQLAKAMNIEYEIIVCKGEYQNVHGVPEEALKKMKERWED